MTVAGLGAIVAAAGTVLPMRSPVALTGPERLFIYLTPIPYILTVAFLSPTVFFLALFASLPLTVFGGGLLLFRRHRQEPWHRRLFCGWVLTSIPTAGWLVMWVVLLAGPPSL